MLVRYFRLVFLRIFSSSSGLFELLYIFLLWFILSSFWLWFSTLSLISTRNFMFCSSTCLHIVSRLFAHASILSVRAMLQLLHSHLPPTIHRNRHSDAFLFVYFLLRVYLPLTYLRIHPFSSFFFSFSRFFASFLVMSRYRFLFVRKCIALHLRRVPFRRCFSRMLFSIFELTAPLHWRLPHASIDLFPQILLFVHLRLIICCSRLNVIRNQFSPQYHSG